MDHSKESKFREDLSNINLNKLLSESIDKSFESANAGFKAEISEIQDPKVLAQKGYDSILDITLKKIEVNLCPRRVVYGYISPEKAIQGIGPLSSEQGEINNIIGKWNSLYPEYFKNLQKDAATNFLSDPSTIKKSKKETEKLEILDKEIAKIKPTIMEYVSSDQIRYWITFYGKIISTRDNKVIWEREELYYDPKCESVKNIQNNPEIMVDMITRSLSNMAVNAVVQILY